MEKYKFYHDMLKEYNKLRHIPTFSSIEREVKGLLCSMNRFMEEMRDVEIDDGYEDLYILFDKKRRIFLENNTDNEMDMDIIYSTFSNMIERIAHEQSLSVVNCIKIALINETFKELCEIFEVIVEKHDDINGDEIKKMKKEIITISVDKFLSGFLPFIIALSMFTSVKI